MSYSKDILSKIKTFGSIPVSVGGEKEKIKNSIKKKYEEFKVINKNLSKKTQQKITNYDSIQEILNMYNIDIMYKNVTKNFDTLTKEQLQKYDTYIGLTNDLVNALIKNDTAEINEYEKAHCKSANEIEEEQITKRALILSFMSSGKSIISSINNTNSQKMTSSIISTKSCLMDRGGNFNLTTERQTSIKSPQNDENPIEITTNAFKELYNNYYDAQKQKTKEIEKLEEINTEQENKNKEIENNLKKSIGILLYPTERDKEPNLQKENKSNYDISLENFSNYIADICEKYKVKNIGDLVQKLENTENEKFAARHIQSFLMCCAVRETQEMFMGNDLSLAMF